MRQDDPKKRFKGYSPTSLTTRHIRDLLPGVLEKIGSNYQDRPDLVLAAWPSVIGPKLAPMTEALSFIEGVLIVKVANSTLHSLLTQNDKPRILKSLRSQFPSVPIKTIVFRLG